MLEWSRPELKDGIWIRDAVRNTECMGSDTSFGNIFLLRDKYDIKIAQYKDFVIRKYNGYNGRLGYTFPIGKGNVDRALEKIEQDAAECNEKLNFCLLTKEQKECLEKKYPGRFTFTSNDGDSDYIYSKTELANLSGKAFHKKKNHVSKFMRTYPDYEYVELGTGNWEDAKKVEDIWYYEHLQEEDPSQLAEYKAISEALDNMDQLEIVGGIIYLNETPVAMTIATRISDDVVDVHFEKAVGESVLNGAYAMINKRFVETLDGVSWVNREEDIGIEGLRKAKMSYRPKIILKKYNAKEAED